MIARLKGLVDRIGADHVVIDVNGVGYLVFCSTRMLSRLPATGEVVAVHIETVVREEFIHLYGFLSEGERALFRLMTGVQGVGARVGLAVLSLGEPDRVRRAIAARDKGFIARAGGVGPKLAGRIVSELGDKTIGPGFRDPGAVEAPFAAAPAPPAVEDAASALVNLGYGRTQALAAAVGAARKLDAEASVPALIGVALKDLGGSVGP